MPSDASSAVVRALSELGPERLAEIGRRAGTELDTKTRSLKMAEQLLHAIGQPEDFGHLGLSDEEVESIGVAVGLGERADWKPRISAEEFERLPFYAKPSYDQDVWNAVSSAIAYVTSVAQSSKKSAAAKSSKKSAAKKPASTKPAANKAAAKKSAPGKKAAARKPAKKKSPAKKSRR